MAAHQMGALRKFLGNQCTHEVIAVTTEETPASALLSRQLHYSLTLCSPWALLFACCKSQLVKALGGWLAGQCLKLLTKDDNLCYSVFTPIILGSAQASTMMEQVQTLPAFLLKGCWRSCCSLPRNKSTDCCVREGKGQFWTQVHRVLSQRVLAQSLSYVIREFSPSILTCIRHMKVLRELKL